jgi:hypothetical protein
VSEKTASSLLLAYGGLRRSIAAAEDYLEVAPTVVG